MKQESKKKTEQKSFFFEDYTESENIFSDKNSKLVKVLKNRVNFLFFIFITIIFIFSIKIIYLSLYPTKSFTEKNEEIFLQG